MDTLGINREFLKADHLNCILMRNIKLRLCFSEPILEEDFGKGSLRASGSITHGSEMSFQDFADLFKIFRLENILGLIPFPLPSFAIIKGAYLQHQTSQRYSRYIQNTCGQLEEN